MGVEPGHEPVGGGWEVSAGDFFARVG
jgi:hypothetical protein